ncbi:hypothetical protein TARUN_10366, partial [Trichoderma arundinaceum]
MAHHQYPQYQYHGGAGYPPPPFAVELDTSDRSQQLEGQVFEMSGESAAPRAEGQAKRPVQATDADLNGGAMQANPWPFYLDQEVKTESRAEDVVKPVAEAKAEQPLANPWAYFGPMSPDGDGDGRDAAGAAAPDAGGLGIRIEESSDSKAKSEDASVRPSPAPESSSPPPPPQHGNQDDRSAEGDPLAAGEPTPPPPSSAPTFYVAPLRVARKQVPPAAAAPAFKPYLPPQAESAAAIAPLNVKHQRPSEGPQGDPATAALPYRPYRPAGHTPPPPSMPNMSDRVDAPVSSVVPSHPASTSSPPPPQSHSPLIAGGVAPQGPPSQTAAPVRVSVSPNPTQQQHHVASTGAPPDGAAPHQFYQPPPAQPQHSPPPPPPPPPPTIAPPPAPPVSAPVPAVAVAGPPSIAAPTPYHISQQPVP